MISRVQAELTDDVIERIAGTVAAWRSEENAVDYQDIAGYCRSVTLAEIAEHGHVLTPGRYVGTEYIEVDGISFEDKVAVISDNLKSHFEQSIELQERIKLNLKKVGIEL